MQTVNAKLWKYKKAMKSLSKHNCVKDYFGNMLKGMKSEAAMRMVGQAPEKISAYLRKLVIDADNITPVYLKGANPTDKKCKGRMGRELAGGYTVLLTHPIVS